jgi:hypothetical protein
VKRITSTAIAGSLAALSVLVLLLPMRGNDSDPPECFAWLGYVVPCGLGPDQSHGMGFAIAGAVIAAALVVVGSVVGRRERDV